MSDDVETVDRPTTGEVEQRTVGGVEVAEKKIRGIVPFGVESRDLGGFREVIEPSAFNDTDISELRCVVDHAGVPIGRYPQTLDVEAGDEGLRWAVTPHDPEPTS